MSEAETPAEIADLLDRTATSMVDIAAQLRIIAIRLRPPPDLPEPSRSGHYS